MMTDPFQDVDSGGPEFTEIVIAALEARAAEPIMTEIVANYLDALEFRDGGLHVEIGAGSGPIARRIAERASSGRVIATDPSTGLIEAGRKILENPANLEFEVADGDRLRFEDASVDNVVLHTVLSHVPEPAALLAEAARILKPGGRLAICDADFEKTSLANAWADPLDACAKYFAENYVTDKYLTGKLRDLVAAAGLEVEDFRVTARTVVSGTGGMTWVGMSTAHMVAQGLIGEELAEALKNEYQRREASGKLYGLQPFVTVIARK